MHYSNIQISSVMARLYIQCCFAINMENIMAIMKKSGSLWLQFPTAMMRVLKTCRLAITDFLFKVSIGVRSLIFVQIPFCWNIYGEDFADQVGDGGAASK